MSTMFFQSSSDEYKPIPFDHIDTELRKKLAYQLTNIEAKMIDQLQEAVEDFEPDCDDFDFYGDDMTPQSILETIGIDYKDWHKVMQYQRQMIKEAVESIISSDCYPYNKDESPDEIEDKIREEVRQEYEDEINETISDKNGKIEDLRDTITSLRFEIERLKNDKT